MTPHRTLYHNGRIVTCDPENRVVEALAVSDGRIAAVGAAAQVAPFDGPQTVRVDLRGRTMLPGFIDPHGHFPETGINALYRVDLAAPPLGSCATLAEGLASLAERAARTAPGRWIIGTRFDQTALGEGRFPLRAELDAISTAHPILVVHISGHALAANAPALAHRGVDTATPDPPGGRIGRDGSGALTGLLEGLPAMGPLCDTGFDIDATRFRAGFAAAAEEYLAQGVTLAQNAWASAENLRDFSAIAAAGDAEIDVVVLPAAEVEPALSQGALNLEWPENDRIRLGPRKLFADGAFQIQTAYLTQPYHRPLDGDPSHRGYPLMPKAQLAQEVARLHAAGFQIHLHANGDAAGDDALDALAAALARWPRADHRHTLIHCQTLRDDQLARMAELGVSASFFPAHIYYWGERHREVFLGETRAARISPLRSALARGLRFTIHNDAGVTPTRPLHLIWCAACRRTAAGRVLGEEQRISPLQALRAHTIDAAWQVFLEHERGSLEPGKRADLAIVSGDPLGDPEALRDMAVDETIVAGEVRYRRV